MTLKNAALLALIGTLLHTILLALDLFRSFSGFLGDVVPLLALLRSFVNLMASFGLTVFFFVFHKAQSR